jgi:hypothetical protein
MVGSVIQVVVESIEQWCLAKLVVMSELVGY